MAAFFWDFYETAVCQQTRYKRKNRGDGNEWIRNAGYRTRIKSIKRYCYISFKKTKKYAKPVNEKFLVERGADKPIDIVIYNALAAECKELSVEMDEMWSFYHDKRHQLWLWWAVDHETNTPLAYVFGTREHKYLDELLELLKPFSTGTVYADNNYAYKDRISEDKLITGKKNTQKIERNHLTLRTRIKRLARKTVCFSKSKEIHMAVIGTFINIFFFGRKFELSTIL